MIGALTALQSWAVLLMIAGLLVALIVILYRSITRFGEAPTFDGAAADLNLVDRIEAERRPDVQRRIGGRS